MVTFEGYDRRIANINKVLRENNLESLEQCRQICLDAGIDVEKIVREIQPICFDNAVWAYTMGTAIAICSHEKSAEKCAENKIHRQQQEQGRERAPKHAEGGSFVFFYKIAPYQFSKQKAISFLF